ncbi:MAG: CYTH domain-containing protein [Gammaproteobacteria bacterium]|nr:MAG: CYTH domain-containing protein [Gammaproteobacteria bacterium]
MGIEIERKFLVTSHAWRTQAARAQRMSQGYLVDSALVQARQGVRCSLRVRIADASAWLNIKSADLGVARQEYDYAIPVADAERMLRDFCNGVVDKTRHYVPHAGLTFEVDEFHGDNAGLIVAELELEAVEQKFSKPDWLGREVSSLPRYYNLNLLAHPYAQWSESERSGD